MIHKKPNRFRPAFKQLFKLKENIHNRDKVLNFKGQKWLRFIQNYKRKLKRYQKFKPHDQTKFIVSKYSNKGTSYKKRYKNTLIESKKFRLFYGNLSKKKLKQQIKKTFQTKIAKQLSESSQLIFLELFENRLDTILYRSKFSISPRNARQFITHKKIFVNQQLVQSPDYILKPGDLIQIDPTFSKVIEDNLRKAKTWPIPPKHLAINYKTLEILMIDQVRTNNLASNFSFRLNLEKVLINFLKH